jgi:hypothetical protein
MARAPKAKTEADNGAHQPDPGLVAAMPDDNPNPTVHCKDCKNWGRQWPQANAAECLLAKRWTSMPVITTDLQTCTQAVAVDA